MKPIGAVPMTRGIIFGSAMVRAILAGHKTQTRRVARGVVDAKLYADMSDAKGRDFPLRRIDRPMRLRAGAALRITMPDATPLQRQTRTIAVSTDPFEPWPCPYGNPGDQLWVRETWRAGAHDAPPFYYQADGGDGPWRPSLFMPRRASRIQLEVVATRMERLRQIDELDALAEGVEGFDLGGNVITAGTVGGDVVVGLAQDAYAKVWDSINGKRVPWASDPWVWVVTFKRIG